MSIFHSKAFCDLHGMTLHHGILPIGKVDGKCVSPARGTFGGFSSGELSDMQEALNTCDVSLVSMAPESHDSFLMHKSVVALDEAGFKVVWHDINYDLIVNKEPLVKRMVSGHRKKLAKCERAGFEARDLDDSTLSQVYALLWDDRKRKGRTLSMSFDALTRQNAVLPDTCKTFGVFSPFGKLVSAAICFRIKPDVLYVFAWGDSGVSEYAPTIMLASHIYDYCRDNNIPIFDVGIATERGVPNDGLMTFKSNIGFKQSLKLTMRIDAL